jgi:predicted Zn-dependent peptidase
MLKKYYIILLFCLSLIVGCKTIFYPSMFSRTQLTRDTLVIDAIDESTQTDVILLQNGVPVLVRENDLDTVRIGFFLRAPSLYQTPVNAGIEKILLNYIQRRLVFKLEREGISVSGSPEISGNADFSSLTVEVEPQNSDRAAALLCNSLVVNSFSYREMLEMIARHIESFNVEKEDAETYLQYLHESSTFRTTPLFNRFSGNVVSNSRIKPGDLVRYYRESFVAERMLFLVNGTGVSRSITATVFQPVEEHFEETGSAAGVYPPGTMEQLFNRAPRFIEQEATGQSIIESLFLAPSFADDDYFSLYLASMLISDNYIRNSSEEWDITLGMELINTINYGRLSIKAPRDETRLALLGFKRVIDKQISGIGSFYYTGDTTDDVERDYRKQQEEDLVFLDISSVLNQYKKEVLDRFDLSLLDTREKEETFIRIYFLFNRIIDLQLLKERLDQITVDDIIRSTETYLQTMSWAILSDNDTLSGLSEDFFY